MKVKFKGNEFEVDTDDGKVSSKILKLYSSEDSELIKKTNPANTIFEYYKNGIIREKVIYAKDAGINEFSIKKIYECGKLVDQYTNTTHIEENFSKNYDNIGRLESCRYYYDSTHQSIMKVNFYKYTGSTLSSIKSVWSNGMYVYTTICGDIDNYQVDVKSDKVFSNRIKSVEDFVYENIVEEATRNCNYSIKVSRIDYNGSSYQIITDNDEQLLGIYLIDKKVLNDFGFRDLSKSKISYTSASPKAFRSTSGISIINKSLKYHKWNFEAIYKFGKYELAHNLYSDNWFLDVSEKDNTISYKINSINMDLIESLNSCIKNSYNDLTTLMNQYGYEKS